MPSEKYFAVRKATNAAASFFFRTAMFTLSTSNGERSAKTLLTTVNSFQKVIQLGPERICCALDLGTLRNLKLNTPDASDGL